MSLVKLLSLSRSFIPGRNGPGRYRMVEQGLLPKFGPNHEIIPRRTGKTLTAAQASPVPVSDTGIGLKSPRGGTARAIESPTPAPIETKSGATSPAAEKFQTSGVARAKRAIFEFDWLFARWAKVTINPFQKRLKDASRSRAVRQAEMSLDTIKVVRNDLWDADFEVVPARIAAKAGRPDSTSTTVTPAQPAGAGLSRLTTRLFNSGGVRL